MGSYESTPDSDIDGSGRHDGATIGIEAGSHDMDRDPQNDVMDPFGNFPDMVINSLDQAAEVFGGHANIPPAILEALQVTEGGTQPA